MSNYWIVDCANCGHQTEIDLDLTDDSCLFCGKPAKIKEVIMVLRSNEPVKNRKRQSKPNHP